MTHLIEHFINGTSTAGHSTERGDVFNPASGKKVAEVVLADKADIDAAVNSAHKAFETWKNVSPLKRAQVLFKFQELLHQHEKMLAEIITFEQGKIFADAAGEVARAIGMVDFACGIPHLLKGEYSENVNIDIDVYSMRQPLGVCAGITPFNFPAMVPMWMFPLAIACGNTFVLKPSEKDPSVTPFLAELFTKAGLPDGVFNIIHGDKVVVNGLLTHPKIAAISFVGSTKVAEYVYKTASANNKRVQALGGAKNHCIILPDVDIEKTAASLMEGAFGSAGERCMSISVALVVGDDLADKLILELKTKMEKLKVADGMDKDAAMGPLVTKQHLDRVCSYIDIGAKEGAKLLVDGRNIKIAGCENGFFVGPTLFDHVTAKMRIYREEIFGPVLAIVRIQDLETGIAMINQHELGNGAVIYTKDGAAARNFASKVHAGMIGINVPIPVPTAFYSFGGWKRSLFGDIHVHGMEGIRFYTKFKMVTSRW